MNNLLDFQEHLNHHKTAIYSINTSQLNPNIKVEKTDIQEKYPLREYNTGKLRDFIIDNSEELRKNGNIFMGEIRGQQVKLTICKAK